MKRNFLKLLFILGLVFTVSCSSDDSNNNDGVELEGTWRLTAWNVGESYDLNNDGTSSSNLLDEIDCYENETITFAAGTATYMSTSYADIYFEAGEEGESDDTYIIECEQEIDNSPATYVRNGNTVTITITYVEDGVTEEDIIIGTLNGNTLSFVIPDGFYVEGDDFTVEVEQDLTYVFTKQ